MSNVYSNDVFPTGSVTIFAQTTAPIGWTKQTTRNNYGLRVVTSTGGGSYDAGISFTSAHKSYTITGDDTTLSASDNPKHYHNSEQDDGGIERNALWNDTDNGINTGIYTSYIGGDSHNHGSKTINLSINYTDVILATKG